MDLMHAIKDRRSIRKFKPDPVSNEDLNKVLEAARWAPSWANTQCSRIVGVKDS
jgi:nitroreductase